MESGLVQQRNVAIDYLKFIAVFMVMNSHMGLCYGKYSMLATGGALGDALFFFASGFTLFYGKILRFDNWYKKRIARIMPTVILTAVVAYKVFDDARCFLTLRGFAIEYWFIVSIFVYYVLLYPIIRYGKGKYAIHLLLIWIVVCGLVFVFWYRGGVNPYSSSYFRCMIFFVFMIQGAMTGKKQDQISFKKLDIVFWLVSIIGFYGLFYFFKNSWMLISTLIPIWFFNKYTYRLCCAEILKRLYVRKIFGNIVYILGSLCLESYMIQFFILKAIGNKWNLLFPFNIPLTMLVILISAYVLNILSNIFKQTFDKAPYNWKEVLLYKKS